MTSTRKTLVSVHALCKDFPRPNGKMFAVLEGVNLDVYDGEFLTILGISGSGKTTLLRCMAGLLAPDRGRVVFAAPGTQNGQAASFVFQNFALFPWLTVRENVEVAVQKLPRKARNDRVDEYLEKVGLMGFEDCYPRELSGGTKQRVSLCRALVSDPMVVFMDEPFSSLDSLTAHSLRAEIERIWAQPDKKIRAVVLVTHNLNEAVLLSDRVVILSTSPGMVYKTIEIQLSRPRNPSLPSYQETERFLETTFSALHLDRLTLQGDESVAAPGGLVGQGSEPSQPVLEHSDETKARIRPVLNTNLVLVEGLILRLSSEHKPMDLYELCDEMAQSVDQMIPAIACAELLGFLLTPGTELILTESGRRFAAAQDHEERNLLFREACLRLPLIDAIFSIVENAGHEGVEKDVIIEQIAMMLPFEDPDLQFDAILKWCRYSNLLTFDADSGLVALGE